MILAGLPKGERRSCWRAWLLFGFDVAATCIVLKINTIRYEINQNDAESPLHPGGISPGASLAPAEAKPRLVVV